jgi:hypothetical protein
MVRKIWPVAHARVRSGRGRLDVRRDLGRPGMPTPTVHSRHRVQTTTHVVVGVSNVVLVTCVGVGMVVVPIPC